MFEEVKLYIKIWVFFKRRDWGRGLCVGIRIWEAIYGIRYRGFGRISGRRFS